MSQAALHRIEYEGQRFALDPESCFCFECDAVSWDVLAHYPHTPANHIYHLLGAQHPKKELEEVVGELEWLRSTGAILKPLKEEEFAKRLAIDHGLTRLSVVVSDAGLTTDGGRSRTQRALALLLGRSGGKRDLVLELILAPEPVAPGALLGFASEAIPLARLAGARLTVVLRAENVPLRKAPALAGHRIRLRAEFSDAAHAADALAWLQNAEGATLAAVSKKGASLAQGIKTGIVLVPGEASFVEAVEALDKEGFAHIGIDLDETFLRNPGLDPAKVFEALRVTAHYYAKRLLAHHYFRLDPIAGLFWRIFNGDPVRRADAAGLHTLALDAQGGLYPSAHWFGMTEYRLGSLESGEIDESTLRGFENIGTLTTPECMRCWARSLCGGGTAALHQALTGAYRHPSEAWCNAQRDWIGSAIGAFNLLSSKGVNFARVYQILGKREQPSLFALARAAFRMQLGIRPIEESDAELLSTWENWNEAAYFTGNETGMYLATRYDREMDSLHPRGVEHEFVLLRKDATPMGLLKLRPEYLPGIARAWIYFRKASDYGIEGYRRSFKTLVGEAVQKQGAGRVIVPVGPREDALAAFLEATGFHFGGTEREALYLHGRHHDLRLYALDAREGA